MKIAFLGDIALIGKYDITKHDEDSVINRLQDIKNVLSKFDYIVANLESPLTDIINSHEYKSMPLRSPTINIKILKYLGINAVSLANNHIYDFGQRGLEECIETLDKNQISHFGIGQEPLYVDMDNKRIAIQGFCCYTSNGWHYDNSKNGKLNALTFENISTFLSKAKSKSCYPIIIPHWGEENTHYPRSEHVHIAKTILEHNACSIVGHHPHVTQGIMREENGLCAFSLGNFIFDDCYSFKNGMSVIQTDDNRHGYILALEFKNDCSITDELIPYYDIDNRIVCDSSGIEEIKIYSSTIKNLFGKSEYELIRSHEQQNARYERLGKRDVHWLINHLNFSSVMTVIQRKKNQKCFVNVVDSFASHSSINSFDGKAIYVGNFGLPNTDAPGKRVYANSLLLTKCGFDVLMIGTDNLVRGRCERISDKISYMSFPSYGKKYGKKYFDWLKREIEKSASKPALFVRYGSPGLAVFDKYLYSYCKANEIPVIVDVVDWLCIDSSNLVFKLIKGMDTFLEKSIFNKKGNGLIAISSYLYKYYERNYKNIIILPPLVEDYSIKFVCNKIPQIVYAGNPFRKGKRVKNVHTIKDRLDIAINSFITLEKRGLNFDFHIIGMSKKEYLIAFPNMGEILNGIEHIHFHDRQTMKKTQDIISTMDFSILLREKNRGTMAGFPTKIVESLSLGVPVITTETSDLKNYIQDGINGFIVDINDQIKLEDQLANIISMNKESITHMKNHIYSDKTFVAELYELQFSNFIDNVMTSDR